MADKIYVIFDGPPGPESPRFIEVENDQRESVSLGQWQWKEDVKRVGNPFYWRLGPFYAIPPVAPHNHGNIGMHFSSECPACYPGGPTDLELAERKIDRLLAAGDALARAMETGMNSFVKNVWYEAKDL